jgi:hypothetical protein
MVGGSLSLYLRRFSSHLTRRFLYCTKRLASCNLLHLSPGCILATEAPGPGLLGASACVNLLEQFLPQTKSNLRSAGRTSHPRGPAQSFSSYGEGGSRGEVDVVYL